MYKWRNKFISSFCFCFILSSFVFFPPLIPFFFLKVSFFCQTSPSLHLFFCFRQISFRFNHVLLPVYLRIVFSLVSNVVRWKFIADILYIDNFFYFYLEASFFFIFFNSFSFSLYGSGEYNILYVIFNSYLHLSIYFTQFK